MSSWLPKLKTLFRGSLLSDNKIAGSRKAEGTSAPVAQGDGSMAAGTININMIVSPEEEKQIPLSENERKILFALAEGAQISCVTNGHGDIVGAHVFGSCSEIDDTDLLNLLPVLLRKSVIDRSNNSFSISPMGRRIVLWLDRQK